MTMPIRIAAALADHYRLEQEIGAGGMATVYLALGDTTRTLEWLERGLDAQAANMAQINRGWRFKPLHSNPAFAAIVRKAGLKLWP